MVASASTIVQAAQKQQSSYRSAQWNAAIRGLDLITGRSKRSSGAALALLLLGSHAASAKRITVVTGDRPITAEFPNSWKVSEIKRGIRAKTADDEVFLRLESYRPAPLRALLGAHKSYLKQEGVTITGTETAREVDFPTYAPKVTEYPATYVGKPTVLRSISVVPKAEGECYLLVSYRASPEGDKDYDGETQGIINSLAASYDGR